MQPDIPATLTATTINTKTMTHVIPLSSLPVLSLLEDFTLLPQRMPKNPSGQLQEGSSDSSGLGTQVPLSWKGNT